MHCGFNKQMTGKNLPRQCQVAKINIIWIGYGIYMAYESGGIHNAFVTSLTKYSKLFKAK